MDLATPRLLHGMGWFFAVSWALFALRIAHLVLERAPHDRGQTLKSLMIGIAVWAMISLFLGMVLWTIALGSVFPDLLRIAAPLACPQGQFELASSGYSYKPGQHGVSRTFYYVLASGAREEITGKSIVWAGLVYSLLWLTAWLWLGKLGLRILHLRPQRLSGESGSGLKSRLHRPMSAHTDVGLARTSKPASHDPAERLRALKRLRDDGLIDAADFERKKAQILGES